MLCQSNVAQFPFYTEYADAVRMADTFFGYIHASVPAPKDPSFDGDGRTPLKSAR